MSSNPGSAPTQQNAVVRFLKEKWLAIVLVIVVVVFIFQNTSTITISLLWWRLSSPLWVTLLAVLVVGALVGYLVRNRRHNNR
ncbi:lipopolysaccharide assembly protein LapA domain-containing protein [Psychromicrobium sp. YIM B11713]|uniref:lipopolysaccharide assembly protein LapA domain-containing protein n=1 Tax=Psychromicrobium sp. YIM B11713 TaxID=3145233 RepID=UPI00374F16B7